jgi:hypothetical protein
MWYSIGISVNKEFIVEPEQLIFLLVVSLIVVTFSLILKVYLAIQNEEIIHQNLLAGYHKLLIALKKEIENESMSEVRFNKMQKVFINDISEIKNQWISLRFILNTLRNN